MKYDIMQIDRMESGGHRIEVRNEKESDVFYADGGPEALDIVKRILAGAEALQNLCQVSDSSCASARGRSPIGRQCAFPRIGDDTQAHRQSGNTHH